MEKERLQKILARAGYGSRRACEKIIEMYKAGNVFSIVLPSILTASGEHEGIPVALVEAMLPA